VLCLSLCIEIGQQINYSATQTYAISHRLQKNRCGSNDRQQGFYAVEWNGSSEDTGYVLGEEVHDLLC